MQTQSSALASAQMAADQENRNYTVYRIDDGWHYTLEPVPQLTEAQRNNGKVAEDITIVYPHNGNLIRPGTYTPPPIVTPTLGTFAMGVNFSSMAIGDQNSPFGTIVPPESYYTYFHSIGVDLIRLPLSWGRVQPTKLGALSSANVGYIQAQLSYAASRNMKVIIEPHNFGQAPWAVNNRTDFINAFIDFWGKIATTFVGTPGLGGYDLMNEWHDQPFADVFDSSQAGINIIRTIDTTLPIYVEGLNYSNAYSWRAQNDGLKNLVDPSNNLIMSAHSYHDHDGSGRYHIWATESSLGVTTNVGVERMTDFFDWCTENGYRSHIGETNVGIDDPNWNTTLRNSLALCQARGAQVTMWQASAVAGADPLSLIPANGRQARQIPVMQQYTGNTNQPIVYYLDGPTRGSPNVVSAAFTLDYRGVVNGTATINLSDGGYGGTFIPSSVSLSGENPIATFTYTPASTTKTVQINVTNNKGWTNPPPIVFSSETDLFQNIALPTNLISDIKLYAPYFGPCRRMRRNSDGAQQDFGFAGDALGSANIGRKLDVAAISAWAPGGCTTVKRYDQSPNSNHMQPVYQPESPASSTNDYPIFALGADNLPSDAFGSKRMDMPSYLENVIGQTIISRFKHTSGLGMLNWNFVSSISFGPTYAVSSNGTQNHPSYENDSIAMGVITGEVHTHAMTWEANKTSGWRTWKDGVISDTKDTHTNTLSADYNRDICHVGYGPYNGTYSWTGELQDVIIWNSAISDSANVAIQNAINTYHS